MICLQEMINVNITELATNSHQVGQWSQPSKHCARVPLLHSSLSIPHIYRVTWGQFSQLDTTLIMLPLVFALLVLDVLFCVWQEDTELGARFTFQEQF